MIDENNPFHSGTFKSTGCNRQDDGIHCSLANMTIPFNPKEYNRFNSMQKVVSFYLEDPDQVLRRRFRRLHFYNLYQKHKHLVELDERVGRLERGCGATNLDPNHTFSTKTLDTLLLDIDKGLKDFGKPETILCSKFDRTDT